MIPFQKYHGLGNDYLVLTSKDFKNLSSELVQIICHRHYGLGSDGILYGPLESKLANFALKIWNPDGSLAEKSGNGLRIFARYLWDQGLVGNEPFSIETDGGLVQAEVLQSAKEIKIAMGTAVFKAEAIPVKGKPEGIFELEGKTYHFVATSVGNPHAVFVLDEPPNAELACKLGPVVENALERFPNRINVQFAYPQNRSKVQVEIWERGAGYTLASGSSSAAVASVMVRLGHCESPVKVVCPGGTLKVDVSKDYALTLWGPVCYVGRFELAPSVLEQKLPKNTSLGL